MTKPAKIDREFVRHVGGDVLAAKLAAMSDVTDEYLVKVSDVAVRAAIALEAALDRASAAAEHDAKLAEQEAKAAEQEAKATEHDAKAAAKHPEPGKKV